MALLLREAIGGTIRRARTDRRRTLRDVSREARVSLGYLSEIERGRKEPSSELLASICDALALPLPDLLDDVAESMRPARPARPRPLALARGIDPALRSAVEEAFAPEAAAAPDDAGAGQVAETGAEPAETGAGEALPADAPTSSVLPPDVDDDEPGAPDAGTEDTAGDDTAAGPTVRLVGLIAVGDPAGPAVVYAA